MSEYLTGSALESLIKLRAHGLAKSLLRESMRMDDIESVEPDSQLSVKASILLTACNFLIQTYERIEERVNEGNFDVSDIELGESTTDKKKVWN